MLYTLVFGLKGSGLSLFLDEPDNFVALREIQPWLSNLSDECGEGFEQAVLISHHPEIINYLGGSSGRFFSRDRNGPVRVHEVAPQITDGLNLAETIARGWDESGRRSSAANSNHAEPAPESLVRACEEFKRFG